MLTTDVTFIVSTAGNTEGLALCLSSILNGSVLPTNIIVRAEGDIPPFSFYVTQLTSLARIRGVNMSFHVVEPCGIRNARDWMLDICPTRYLFMGDDDVVYDWDAFERLWEAMVTESRFDKNLAYCVGNKRDVNNRRGYGDFSTKEVSFTDETNQPTYLYYDKVHSRGKTASVVAIDTGFVLFDLDRIRHHGIRFGLFDWSYNAGGEDNLFGISCHKHGLMGLLVPSAQAHHLEKETQNFSESAARAEMIVRSAEAAKIADGNTEYEIFPWLKPHFTKGSGCQQKSETTRPSINGIIQSPPK